MLNELIPANTGFGGKSRLPASLAFVLALASVVLNCGPALAAAESSKPNVIVILSDDLGSIDANCYGAIDLVTPAVDSLAAQGSASPNSTRRRRSVRLPARVY